MRILKILYILFAVNAFLFGGQHFFDRDDIRNIAARDIYDLLSKISEIHASGYGITGQPVMFERAGKLSNGIELYIDDIYYGRTVYDLSFISVDQIERIETGRVSGSSGGLSVKIYTLSYNSEMPVSEVTYRDAFFNYRNLSANIYQNFNEDYSFLLSGEFFDWKDNREQADNFRYPYQRQNFRLRLNFPEYSFTKPGFETQYFTEEKYVLESDSSYLESSRFRTSIYFDNSSGNIISNRLVITHELDTKAMKTGILNTYDSFILGDSLNQVEITPGITAQYNTKTYFYIKPEYRFNGSAEAVFGGYAGYCDKDNKTLSANAHFCKEFEGSLYINTSHGYFYNEKEVSSNPEEFFENYISAGKKFLSGKITHDLGAGYDIISYFNRPYGMPFDQWEPQREYLRLKYHLNFGSTIKFGWDHTAALNSNVFDDIAYKNVIRADFSDRYFNDKLNINISLQHVYSEFHINDSSEIMNNLSFNLRARIVNLEFFFGSDNFLKNSYTFGDRTFTVNDHYSFETIKGFEMRRHDEIWGVRWIFYR
ncbi:MAG: hypothetical protein JXN63_05225 [Candidatus Delongbacteria bacterium]|nr:hypothetical protein [Candidatus Delongbacteria bacterium]